MRGVRDAMQAGAHIRGFDFVDKQRVAMAGYSWGAMVGLLASSKLWGETLCATERFAAVVSFYPGCVATPATGPAYDVGRVDIDRPLLVLMGDLDNETPPADCIPRFEAARVAGGPVEWHLYPQTTHCFDCANLNNFTKTDARGNRVTYRYSRENTKDAAERMFAFLDRHLNVKR
jgi:dienelactone hydrolase